MPRDTVLTNDPSPINRRNVLMKAPHSTSEHEGMEGSKGTFKPLYVPFSREGTRTEAERGEAPQEPMTVQITYESDEAYCFDCQGTRKHKTHLLFWFSGTYCRRICQGCARRSGGRIWAALQDFLKPFDYRTPVKIAVL